MLNSVLERISVNAHSSVRVDAGGKILYFDPFLVKKAANDGDVVFFTHSHYDHFSPDDFAKLAKSDATFVMPRSMRSDAEKAGVSEAKIVAMSPGETSQVAGVAVEAVAAYNPAKQFHPKSSLWLGYVVTIDGCRVYVAGDTEANDENRRVKCDIALVPIGGTYTFDAKSAAEFVNEIRPQVAVPTHYGSDVGKMSDADEFKKLVAPEIRVVTKIA